MESRSMEVITSYCKRDGDELLSPLELRPDPVNAWPRQEGFKSDIRTRIQIPRIHVLGDDFGWMRVNVVELVFAEDEGVTPRSKVWFQVPNRLAGSRFGQMVF